MPSHSPVLTHRQHEAACLAAQGLMDKQIADRLGISYKTANNHVVAAMKALGVAGRVNLALFAVAMGWVTNPFQGATRPTVGQRRGGRRTGRAMAKING